MRTSALLPVVGIAVLLFMMASAGAVYADQTMEPSSTTLSPAIASWTGGGGLPLLLVRGGHHGSRGGSMHHGRHFRGGLFLGSPFYGYPYYGGYYDNDTLIDQPACLWNGYKYRCFGPDGNPL